MSHCNSWNRPNIFTSSARTDPQGPVLMLFNGKDFDCNDIYGLSRLWLFQSIEWHASQPALRQDISMWQGKNRGIRGHYTLNLIKFPVGVCPELVVCYGRFLHIVLCILCCFCWGSKSIKNWEWCSTPPAPPSSPPHPFTVNTPPHMTTFHHTITHDISYHHHTHHHVTNTTHHHSTTHHTTTNYPQLYTITTNTTMHHNHTAPPPYSITTTILHHTPALYTTTIHHHTPPPPPYMCGQCVTSFQDAYTMQY